MPSSVPTTVPVVWLITAHDQLENILGQAGEFVGRDHAQQRVHLNDRLEELSKLLRDTFEKTMKPKAIVVLERLGGYSGRADRHVLRVEITRSDARHEDSTPQPADAPVGQEATGTVKEAGASQGSKAGGASDQLTTEARMVKIGPCTELCKEVIGRSTCERSANARGRTLLHVEPGFCPRSEYVSMPQSHCRIALEREPDATDQTGKSDAGAPTGDSNPSAPTGKSDKRAPLGAIIYEDTYHTLRAARVASLEKAFLNSVRWGVPSPTSILSVLEQVYQELQNHCYERAPAIQPKDMHRLKLRERLRKGADRWAKNTSVPGERRIICRELLPHNAFPFVDLLDFYNRAFRQVDYLPELRFGRAHGDLHGRNVAVGLINGEANWPAVYDFEDMGVNNFVAWDFVKMETELKVRAIEHVFHCPPAEFVERVWKFEQRLNLMTEAHDQQPFDAWQDAVIPPDSTAEARLLALLLGLRRRAKRYLQMQGPPRVYRWLHEYYFFLACYGIYAGRFQTYTASECMAVYLGASCAATRYTWGVEYVYQSKEEGKNCAQRKLDNAHWLGVGCPIAPAAGCVFAAAAFCTSDPPASPARPPSPADARDRWDVRLEKLKVFARSKDKAFVEEAVRGLLALKNRVPTAAEVIAELVLALIEFARLTGERQYYCDALAELNAFERLQCGLYTRDVELLARAGRIWKDCGDQALESNQSPYRVHQPDPGWSGSASGSRQFALNAVEWYTVSASYYRRAFEASYDYYPGVNLATLTYLIAALKTQDGKEISAEDKKAIQEVLKKIREQMSNDDKHLLEWQKEWDNEHPGSSKDDESRPRFDDEHWRWASLGEASLLLEETKEAFDCYEKAWKHEKIVKSPQSRESIKIQANRIMVQQARLKTPSELSDLHRRLRELFGHP